MTDPAGGAGGAGVSPARARAVAAGVPIASFDPHGGPISARVSSGFAQPGSYTFILWEANVNRIVMERSGNFLNSDDDEYVLVGFNADQHGRYAQALVTVAITPPELRYELTLEILQDGATLAADVKNGKGTAGEAVTRTLWVFLESQ